MTERDTNPEPEGIPEDDQWVTLREASDAAGISVSGLRKWYRTGQIESTMGPGPTGPRRMVRLPEVLERAGKTATRAQRTGPVPPGLELVPASMFQDLQTAYLAAQERAVEAEVRARVAEHDLMRNREELARLRDELAASRPRGWFRRRPKGGR